jgi:hypothetical protein
VADQQRIGEKLELNCETSFASPLKLATSDNESGESAGLLGSGRALE